MQRQVMNQFTFSTQVFPDTKKKCCGPIAHIVWQRMTAWFETPRHMPATTTHLMTTLLRLKTGKAVLLVHWCHGENHSTIVIRRKPWTATFGRDGCWILISLNHPSLEGMYSLGIQIAEASRPKSCDNPAKGTVVHRRHSWNFYVLIRQPSPLKVAPSLDNGLNAQLGQRHPDRPCFEQKNQSQIPVGEHAFQIRFVGWLDILNRSSVVHACLLSWFAFAMFMTWWVWLSALEAFQFYHTSMAFLHCKTHQHMVES